MGFNHKSIPIKILRKLGSHQVYIFLVLVLAFILRTYGITFGLPHLYYWDEPTVVQRAMRFGSGDLNPHFFYYPSLYMYVIFIMSGIYYVGGSIIGIFSGVQDFAANFFLDPTGVYFVARLTTACIGTLSVFLIYIVGRLFFTLRVGALGSLFFTVCVLHSTHSHIAVTDVPHTMFIISAYIPMYGIMKNGRWRSYLLCGVLIGLGTATKYLAILMVPSILIAHILYYYKNKTSYTSFQHSIPSLILKPLSAIVVVFLGFFIGSPYNFIDFKTFLTDYQQQAALSSGAGQSTGVVFFLKDVLPATLGWPLYLLGILGIVLIISQHRRIAILFLAFPLIYFVFVARYSIIFPRYMIPVEPFIALAAAYSVVWIFDILRMRYPYRWLTVSFGTCLLVLILPPLYMTLLWDRAMAHEKDTRTLALEWTRQHIPSGSRVAVQPLYGRTYFNVPIMTDLKMNELEEDIPQEASFEEVRKQVFSALMSQPTYQDIPFEYDYEALQSAGVQFVFTSDQNWQATSSSTSLDSPQTTFKALLEGEARLIARFNPPTDIRSGKDVFPVIPPEISIYDITPP